MATASAEDRLDLIRDALFPVEEDDYCDFCEGPCCDADPFGDEFDPVSAVVNDAVVATFERLTDIVETGSNEDAIIASNILLGNLIALSDRGL